MNESALIALKFSSAITAFAVIFGRNKWNFYWFVLFFLIVFLFVLLLSKMVLSNSDLMHNSTFSNFIRSAVITAIIAILDRGKNRKTFFYFSLFFLMFLGFQIFDLLF